MSIGKQESALPVGVTLWSGLTGGAGEMLDVQAKREYKRRLLELREELEDLRERGERQSADKVAAEVDFLAREIRRAVGLGGRDRRAGSAAERARLNVTRAIKAALQKISERDRSLGEMLDASIRTGAFCAYQLGSGDPITWQFSTDLTGSSYTSQATAPFFSSVTLAFYASSRGESLSSEEERSAKRCIAPSIRAVKALVRRWRSAARLG
ncbi:MAG: hypothetical protein ACREQN_15070 [Candidatus Binataceae bacterium]